MNTTPQQSVVMTLLSIDISRIVRCDDFSRAILTALVRFLQTDLCAPSHAFQSFHHEKGSLHTCSLSFLNDAHGLQLDCVQEVHNWCMWLFCEFSACHRNHSSSRQRGYHHSYGWQPRYQLWKCTREITGTCM